MRSLMENNRATESEEFAQKRSYISDIGDASMYTGNLMRLRHLHHAHCLFNRDIEWMPKTRFVFDDAGVLHGDFVAGEPHQGYDGKVHGGLLSALIDASMAQCLMGHAVTGYTADLSVRYRKPVIINTTVTMTTCINTLNLSVLYTLSCEMRQCGNPVVTAIGKFYQFSEHHDDRTR